MSRVRRGPALVVGVAATTLLLVVAARGLGRLAWPPAPADRSAAAPARASASGMTDLTFFRALGPPPPGKRPVPTPDATLRPAPGDVVAAGAYIVQVAATGDPGQAKRLRDRLTSHGIPAVVVEDDTGPAPMYRVRVGRWKERGPAEEMAAKIRKQEGVEPWVLQESGP